LPRTFLHRLTGLEKDEGNCALRAGTMFFCLMTAYFILRPLRDEMGIAGGVANLPYLYLVTLGVMLAAAPLFAWLSRGRRREEFLPPFYRFFGLNLLVFFGLLHTWPAADLWLGRVFYVWVSVFNLFSLSVFWGFLADGLGLLPGRRIFGLVAIGGTVGAVLGAGLTDLLVNVLGRLPLLLLSVAFLELAVRQIAPLSRRFHLLADAGDQTPPPAAAPSRTTGALGPSRASLLEGVALVLRSPYLRAICLFLLLYSLSSTFLYLAQAGIVAAAADGRAARAQLLARIEVWVQSSTLLIQLLLTGRALRRFGSGRVLAVLPLVTAAGFLALGLHPVLIVLVVVQVLRRMTNYALVKPARESLFADLQPAAQYRAKSFIDTFVYRGGDALGAGVYSLLTVLGLGLAGISLAALPLCLAWTVIALRLGRSQARRSGGGDIAFKSPPTRPIPAAENTLA
jgi:ATP:ADP antiporter, AAA family